MVMTSYDLNPRGILSISLVETRLSVSARNSQRHTSQVIQFQPRSEGHDVCICISLSHQTSLCLGRYPPKTSQNKPWNHPSCTQNFQLQGAELAPACVWFKMVDRNELGTPDLEQLAPEKFCAFAQGMKWFQAIFFGSIFFRGKAVSSLGGLWVCGSKWGGIFEQQTWDDEDSILNHLILFWGFKKGHHIPAATCLQKCQSSVSMIFSQSQSHQFRKLVGSWQVDAVTKQEPCFVLPCFWNFCKTPGNGLGSWEDDHTWSAYMYIYIYITFTYCAIYEFCFFHVWAFANSYFVPQKR